MASEAPKPPAPREPDGAVVELHICNDLVNAVATAYDADGKVMDTPSRIEVRPQFMTANGIVNLSRCIVMASRDGVRSQKSVSMLRVSGANGKMKVDELAKAITPKFMLPEGEEPEDEDEDEEDADAESQS